MHVEVQDELLLLLRSQQRELTDLRGQIEAMQSSIMAQVEHVLTNHQEQERILRSFLLIFGSLCILKTHEISEKNLSPLYTPSPVNNCDAIIQK